jgi:hypothetical protein
MMTMPRPAPRMKLTLACMLLFATGCYVQSIHPLYDDKTMTFDPALVGTWVADEDEEFVFTVSDTTRGMYTLVNDEGGASARFQAVLLELRRRVPGYLPDAPESENTFYMDHLIRVHNILRVEMDVDTLWVSDFDAEWLQTMVDKKRVRLSHVPLDGAMLLTGSTAELQAFVQKYAKTPEAFSEPAKFIRTN